MGFLAGGFWIGIHRLSLCSAFDRSCVSVNQVRGRGKSFRAANWMMDSGAFTELKTYGRYRHSPEQYLSSIRCWSVSKTLRVAASQDYMCEPFILAKTGLSVEDHQRLTIKRYDVLRENWPRLMPVHLLPVIQGYEPAEYAAHVRAYGDRLAERHWVGVGSVCKRNAAPASVRAVLEAIKAERPDLRLHGFGLKITALADRGVLALLHSSDSMAWSFSARMKGRDGNSLEEAQRFYSRVQEVIAGG